MNMKPLFLVLLSSILVSSIAMGSELYSSKLRTLTCKEISRSVRVIKTKDCLTKKINIVNAKQFDFEDKKYTLAMQVVSHNNRSQFVVELKRKASIDDDKLVLMSWTAKLINTKLGNYHTLLLTHESSSNIVEVKKEADLKKLPMTVLKWISSDKFEFPGADRDTSFYRVYNKRKQLIGFLAKVWFESEADDIKGYNYQRFSTKGRKVGSEDGESFGYHE